MGIFVTRDTDGEANSNLGLLTTFSPIAYSNSMYRDKPDFEYYEKGAVEPRMMELLKSLGIPFSTGRVSVDYAKKLLKTDRRTVLPSPGPKSQNCLQRRIGLLSRYVFVS